MAPPAIRLTKTVAAQKTKAMVAIMVRNSNIALSSFSHYFVTAILTFFLDTIKALIPAAIKTRAGRS